MVELDPKDREWEYDGNGVKIYKYDPRFPVKRRYEKTELDGGVPFEKGDKDERETNTVLHIPRKGTR